MVPTLIATAMLFGCFVDGLPYGYFQILRWVVCGTCAYRVSLCLESGHERWLWVFLVAGILFNPIIPVHLARDAWLAIDGMLGIIMLVSLALVKKTEPEQEAVEDARLD